MRRHFLLLLIGLFLCFPVLVNAKETVHISKVEKIDSSGFAEELEEPSFEGLDLSLHFSFVNVNDSIQYQVMVQNDTDKDYELSDQEALQNSDYVLYQFDFNDDSNVVKAQSDKMLTVTVRYMKEVPESLFQNGSFVEKKEMNISLMNDTKTTNPNTGIPYLLIGITGIASIIGLSVAISNRRYLKFKYGVFLLGFLLLPFACYALEVLKIHINSNAEIVKYRRFCYVDNSIGGNDQTYYEFTPGITMNEYLEEHPDLTIGIFSYHEGQLSKEFFDEQLSELTNGEYTDFSTFESSNDYWEYVENTTGTIHNNLTNIGNLYYNRYTTVFKNNLILDETVGCYKKILPR